MRTSPVTFHIAANCGGCSGITGYWAALNAAGIPFTVYSVDIGGILAEAAGFEHAALIWRSVAPSTVDPYHYSLPPDAVAGAYWQRTLDAVPPEVKALKGRVWLELMNEPGREPAQAQWVGAVMLGMARLALAQGWRVMGPGWAPGNPEPEAWRYPSWRDYLELCAARPDAVAVSVHEGSLDLDIHRGEGWMMGRFAHLFAACDEMGIARPPLHVTECGWNIDSMPELEQAKRDIQWMAGMYAAHPQIRSVHLWTLQGGPHNGELPGKLNSLMPWLRDYTIEARFDAPAPPDPPPAEKHTAVVVLLPQDVTADEMADVARMAHRNLHTMTPSHDDALTMLRGGNERSYAKVYRPARQPDRVKIIEAAGYRWEEFMPPPAAFAFAVYPVDGERAVTQAFGARPEVYAPYGLPGHEGVDLRAVLNAPVRAVAEGVVQNRSMTATYGNAVRVRHADGWITVYAHLSKFGGPVSGDAVAAGQVIGYAGSTGNSTGVHLHLTLQREGMTYTAPGGVVWPNNVFDPTPLLAPHLAIDLLDYLCGDGRSYRVANADDGSEVFQSQREGDRFYQVKAWGDLSVVNWEQFIVDAQYIRRDVDTSPGGGRFYRQLAGSGPGAPWVKRRMAIGESFTQAKRVQFHRLSDCTPLAANSGDVTDTITVVALHPTYTFRTGARLNDVVELRWEQGGERYFYARGYGLCGWERAHQDPNTPAWSAIAEMRPDVGKLARLRIPCL